MGEISGKRADTRCGVVSAPVILALQPAVLKSILVTTANAMMLTSVSPTMRPKQIHLPLDKAEALYGVSADTADRDLGEFRDAEIQSALTIYIPYVLAATGWAKSHMHQLGKQSEFAVPVDLSAPQGLKEVPLS